MAVSDDVIELATTPDHVVVAPDGSMPDGIGEAGVVWVLTLFTQDAKTIHVESPSRQELDETLNNMQDHFGGLPDEVWRLDPRPVGWTCNGHDGCLNDD